MEKRASDPDKDQDGDLGGTSPSDRVRVDVYLLKGIGLIDYQGREKGVRWFLTGRTG